MKHKKYNEYVDYNTEQFFLLVKYNFEKVKSIVEVLLLFFFLFLDILL